MRNVVFKNISGTVKLPIIKSEGVYGYWDSGFSMFVSLRNLYKYLKQKNKEIKIERIKR